MSNEERERYQKLAKDASKARVLFSDGFVGAFNTDYVAKSYFQSLPRGSRATIRYIGDETPAFEYGEA